MPAPQTPRRERPEDRVSPRCEGSAGRRKAACAQLSVPRPFEPKRGWGYRDAAPRARRFSAASLALLLLAHSDGGDPFGFLALGHRIETEVFLRVGCNPVVSVRLRLRGGPLLSGRLASRSCPDSCQGRDPRLCVARYATLHRAPIESRDPDGPDRPLTWETTRALYGRSGGGRISSARFKQALGVTEEFAASGVG